MQILILSDIHANWYALEAVLAEAKGQYDQIVCCGDLVGYNPHPAQVVDWTQKNCSSVIRGNHDKVVAGLEDLSWFNETAQTAARWTIDHLTAAQISYLAGLSEGPKTNEYFELVHGSPNDEDEYITNSSEAATCFPHVDVPLTFFGHTHHQGGFFSKRGNIGTVAAVKKKQRESVVQLEVDTKYMINPGSVGQPRDGDVRAAYALYDTDRKLVTLRRTMYPIALTSSDIQKAGLPELLGARLFHGF